METHVPLPEGAVTLNESGCFMYIEEMSHNRGTHRFWLYRQTDSGMHRILIADVRLLEASRWNMAEVAKGHRASLYHEQNTMNQMGRGMLTAYSEIMFRLADYLKKQDERLGPELEKAREQARKADEEAAKRRAEREEEMRRYREERAKQQEEENKRVAEIYELVRWYVDQKFRLTRVGYRATVFGTIREVTPTYMRTISEKNVPMRIALRDLKTFDIKYEDDKRYTNIYKRKEEPANA